MLLERTAVSDGSLIEAKLIDELPWVRQLSLLIEGNEKLLLYQYANAAIQFLRYSQIVMPWVGF